jgi:hypothetical protein
MYMAFLQMLFDDRYHLGLRRLQLLAVSHLLNTALRMTEQEIDAMAKKHREESDFDELHRIWKAGRDMYNDKTPDRDGTDENGYDLHCGKALHQYMYSLQSIKEFAPLAKEPELTVENPSLRKRGREGGGGEGEEKEREEKMRDENQDEADPSKRQRPNEFDAATDSINPPSVLDEGGDETMVPKGLTSTLLPHE